MPGIIPPRSDLLFKRIFGDPRNIDILTAFLKAVLPTLPAGDFATVTLGNTVLPVDQVLDKESILDVNVVTGTGRQIDIEIQLLPYPHLPERLTYYTASMLTRQLKSGQEYIRLKQVISILITAHDLIGGSDVYHHRFHLSELDTGLTFSTVMEINTLELTKLPSASDGTPLWDWLTFVNAETEEELDMAATLDPTIEKAATIVRSFSIDETLRLQAESREKWKRDVATLRAVGRAEGLEEGREEGLKEGREEGRAEGRAEGIKEDRLRGIRAGLAQGYDPQILATIFRISVDEVHRIAADHVD